MKILINFVNQYIHKQLNIEHMEYNQIIDLWNKRKAHNLFKFFTKISIGFPTRNVIKDCLYCFSLLTHDKQ
jgi:hypothetical protein